MSPYPTDNQTFNNQPFNTIESNECVKQTLHFVPDKSFISQCIQPDKGPSFGLRYLYSQTFPLHHPSC
jgi:hypothetical protein